VVYSRPILLINPILGDLTNMAVGYNYRSGCIEKEPSSNCVRLTDLTCSS